MRYVIAALLVGVLASHYVGMDVRVPGCLVVFGDTCVGVGR